MLQVWSRRVLGVVLVLAAVAVAPRVLHAQTGKITGIVTDQANGQPLDGVQVFLQGTGYGTITNANGRYFLLTVPPGTYNVATRRIGYAEQAKQITVQIDVTREVNFALTASATQIGKVVVQAEAGQPLFNPGATSTSRIIDAQEISQLPVTSIEGALALQQGFVQVPNSTDLISYAESRTQATNPISIRGGRGGETLMMIDGIPVNNFIYGGPAFSLSPLAVQQIDFIKGSMEPQYGNALSGVINIATKEGGNDLEGALNYTTGRLGDALGNTPDALRGYNLVEGYVAGPIPGTSDRLTFMVSGREERSADAVYKYDNQIFIPSQMPGTEAEPANGPNFRDLFPGWRGFGYNNQRQAFGKLTYKLPGTAKLGFTFLDNENQRMPFDNQYLTTYGSALNSPAVRSAADSAVFIGNLTGYRIAPLDFEKVVENSIDANQRLYAGRLDQTINRTSYQLIAGVFQTKRLTCNYFQGVCLQDQFGDPNFTDDQYIGPLAGTCATNPTCGTDQYYGGERLSTYVLRGDVQSQVTDHHNLQGGVLYQGYNLNVNLVQDVGTNLVNIYRQQYANKPFDFAAYVQDRIEYDFLTLKLGGRFDYGKVPGTFFANPLDPTNGTTSLDVCANPNDPRWKNGVLFHDFTADGRDTSYIVKPDPNWATNGCTTDERDKIAKKIATFDDFAKAKARKQFSPRIGVSFPLSQTSAIYFNFGRYTQNPLLNNLLTNTGIGTKYEGTIYGPIIDVPGEGGPGFIGNPNLSVEQTTTYEIGYNAEIGKDYGLGVSLYNKNQTGLTGLRQGGQRVGQYGYEQVFDPSVTYGSSNTPSYQILVNQDFQTVRGIEAQLRRRVVNYWGYDINYSYSSARTNASDPSREYERQILQGDPNNLTEVTSDLDQPNVFKASLITAVGNDVPKFRFGNWLRNASGSLTFTYASGLPYTPVTGYFGTNATYDKFLRNSERGPAQSTFNLQLQKGFQVSNLRYDAFVQVYNLLNTRNCIQVFETTGTCTNGAIDQSRARQGNSVRPDAATSTFVDRGDYYGDPRYILGGIKVRF